MTEEMYWAFGLAGVVVMAAGVYWLYGWMDSLHPLRTPVARKVARQLADTPSKGLAAAIRSLTDDEFASYFNELKPPGLINHPAEAYAYARVAHRWSRPRLLRRHNEALRALAEIYDDEQRRLSANSLQDAVRNTLADDWRQRRREDLSA